MSRPGFLKNISLLLTVNFLLSPALFTASLVNAASDDSGVLQQIQSVSNGAQQAITQIGVSQMQIQTMVNQMAMYSQAGANFNPAQGTFAQTAAQLGMAYAQMQQCTMQQVQSAEKSAKALKGKNNAMAAADIENSTPSCGNSLDIRESVKRIKLQLDALSAETGNCMGAFKRNVDSVIENVKKPFDQLTTAANQQAQVYDQLIGGYDKAYNKIQNDLEGENGYRAQLKGLQDLKQQMNDVLNKAGDGLNRRISNLQRQRHGTASSWMATLMDQTFNACFQNDFTMPCEDDGTPASPASCLLRQVSSLNGSDGAAKKAGASYNQKVLQNIFTQQFGVMRQAFLATNTDVNDVNGFATAATARFVTLNQQATNLMLNGKFRGDIDASQKQAMANFFASSMNKCFTTKMNEFKTAVAPCYNTASADNANHPDSEAASTCAVNQYSQPLAAIQEEEKNILNDANKVIEDATTRMNSFRTGFTKVFNNDLAQFKANCAASNSAYQAVTCVNTVNKILDSGLNGTNGAAPTVMNVNTVQMINGTPQQGMQTFQCVGFNDCLNVLGKARDFNREQRDAQTAAKKQFAMDNNKTIDAAFGAIAQQFAMNGQLMNQQVTAINAALKGLGVETTLETKAVEGEDLVVDEKSGLYKTPKNMKAALANKTGFMDITPENLKAVQASIAKKYSTLAKKGAEANAMLSKCEVKDSDYASIASKLTHCEDATSVCSKRGSLMGTMEAIINKSALKFSEEPNKIRDDLRSCLQQSKSSNSSNPLEYLKVDKDSKQDARKMMELSDLKTTRENGYCLDSAKEDLDQSNDKNTRSPELKKNNTELLAEIDSINASCTKFASGDSSAASDIQSSCEGLKTTAKSMKAPKESTDDETDPDDVDNPLRRAKAKTAD